MATAGPADVELALAAAERGAATWRRTPAHERMRILLEAAELADERTPQIAATISAENGKTITEATAEAGRSGDLIRLSAFEGTQLYGDTLPLDANKGTGFDKIGFTVRQPVRRRRGDHPVQLPGAAGAAQDRTRRWRPGTRSSSSRPAPPR